MDLTRIFKLLDARPFVPFEVRQENGQQVRIDHPENVTIFPGRHKVVEILVYYPDREDYDIIWPKGITSVHVLGRGGDGSSPL